jgi:hypothetical protein
MSSREITLAILLSVLIAVGGGGGAGYMLVYAPIQEKKQATAQLTKEVEELRTKVDKARADGKRLALAKRRSLPADENLARREYTEVMFRLLRRANVPLGFSVVTKPATADRTIPLLPGPGKKPAYTKVVAEIEFRKADMWAVADFLRGYYDLNLLHQITAISIKRDEDAGAAAAKKTAADRRDLTVKLTTEAIILDGAENRRTLLPMPTAFAAVGGVAGSQAIVLTPEAGRGVTPLQLAPVLSPRRRDYTLLVLRDMFHGTLPPPERFQVARLPDVTAEVEKPIPPVKVPFVGDPMYYGKVTLAATADGKLLPAGSVKVDQAAKTVTILPVPGELGTGTVTVTAKAENGQEGRASFKVIVKEKAAVAEKERDAIDMAILLIAVSTRSDGTAFAIIRDNANKLKYEVEATTRRVKVTKFFYVRDQKKKDPDYDVSDELVISDDWSATSRRFRIVAVDDTGLILADLKPAEKAPAAPAKGGFGKGGFGKPPAARDKMGEGPADPLAVVIGAAAAHQPPQPVLYRWVSGKSLKGLVEVPRDEAKRIIQKAAQTGPVGATEVAATDTAAR